MAGTHKLLRISGKIILWFSGIFLSLFVALWLILKVPAVQNALVSKATHYISDKTHTEVSLEYINLGFPKSLILEGVYLEDLNHDTLLYVRKFEADLNMLALLHNTVDIQKIGLYEGNVYLVRSEQDSTFNFQFLLNTFTKNDLPPAQEDTSSSLWEMKARTVLLEQCRFTLNDSVSGMLISGYAGAIEAELESLHLNTKSAEIGDVRLSSVRASVKNRKPPVADLPGDTASSWNNLSIGSVSISESSVEYNDLFARQYVWARLPSLVLQHADISLLQQTIHADEFGMNRCVAIIEMVQDTSAANKKQTKTDSLKPGWKVTLNTLDLKQNAFRFDLSNKPPVAQGIDWNHLYMSPLSASVKHILYDRSVIKADIDHLQAQEKSGFVIRSMQGRISIDSTMADISGLSLHTNQSYIGQHLSARYRSLSSIAETGIIDCSLTNNRIAVSELLMLAPQLDSVAIIHQNKKRTITFTLEAEGSAEQLLLKQLTVQTLSTTADASGILRHLTDPGHLFMDVKIKTLQTGRADLQALLASGSLPSSITVPSSLHLDGTYKGTLSDFGTVLNMHSSSGDLSIKGSMQHLKSERPGYTMELNMHAFNAGECLQQASLGKVTGEFLLKGTGFSPQTASATIHAVIKSAGLQQYTYHNMNIDAALDTGFVAIKAAVADTNLHLTIDGKANLNKGNEFYDGQITLKGADLDAIGLTTDHITASGIASVHISGNALNNLNGHVAVRNILIIKNTQQYKIDSLVMASINEPGKNSMKLNSSVLAATFEGNIDIFSVVPTVTNHLNRYIRMDETENRTSQQNFTFEIQLNDSPLLREVILPSLTSYDPVHIKGGFDSGQSKLWMDATVPSVVYDQFSTKGLTININSDAEKLTYNTGWSMLKSNSINIQQTSISGSAANNIAGIGVEIKDEEGNNKLSLKSQIAYASEGRYRFSIAPDGLVMENTQWQVSEKNYIEFAKNYLFADQFILQHEKESLALQSSAGGDDLSLKFSSFSLHTLSQIAEKDTMLVQGILNGNIQLKQFRSNPAFTSELTIDNLGYKQSMVGDLHLTADNLTAGRYSMKAVLTDKQNKVVVSGYYAGKEQGSPLNFTADIETLQLASIEAFSGGQLSESTGTVKGNASIAGTLQHPLITGDLRFIKASTHIAYINSHVYMEDEKIHVTPEKISFKNFSLKDSLNNTAVIDGSIDMESFQNMRFNISVTTNDFLVLNTTSAYNKLYYGKVILDSKIQIKGTPDLPVITADLDIVRGSHFTFAMPESKMSIDRGDGVVVFVNDSASVDPIMLREDEKKQAVKKITGIDLSATISVNRNSTFKLLVDPVSGDSLSVKGDANLKFNLRPNGQTTLTGRYILSEGSYKASLENVVVRKFELRKGSSIIWSGDPLDALVDISATYSTRTSPDGLLLTGAVTDSAALSKPLPFYVILFMKGELLKPVISFQIDMPENARGAIGGEVYSRLGTLNSNESELNKQVFSLLVLNRFLPSDNSSSNGGASSFARRSVSRMMSNELNKLSAQYVKGLEIDVDVQSYNQVNSGQQQGNTMVQLGVTKTLLDERLSVQVGGNVNVEGKGATTANNMKNFAGDMELQYKLTKNGRYRVKGFRINQYDGISNGVITQTGVGFMFVRNYTHTRELFSSKKRHEEK